MHSTPELLRSMRSTTDALCPVQLMLYFQYHGYPMPSTTDALCLVPRMLYAQDHGGSILSTTDALHGALTWPTSGGLSRCWSWCGTLRGEASSRYKCCVLVPLPPSAERFYRCDALLSASTTSTP
eukprot:901508-Rhodomonas_salina.1